MTEALISAGATVTIIHNLRPMRARTIWVFVNSLMTS